MVEAESVPKQTLVVESTFLPYTENIQKFVDTGKWRGIKSKDICSAEVVSFCNTFYDNIHCEMKKHDISLRKCNGAWEMDVPLCRDLAISACTRVYGYEDIKAKFETMKLGRRKIWNIEEFKPFTTMRTIRKQWLIEGLTFAIDHIIIEVEPALFPLSTAPFLHSMRGCLYIPHTIGRITLSERVEADYVPTKITKMADRIETFKQVHKAMFQDKLLPADRLRDRHNEMNAFNYGQGKIIELMLESKGNYKYSCDWTIGYGEDGRAVIAKNGWDEYFGY
ncbi:hypothetical protein EJ07DRAFT_179068 [Lizonia empirigonia]|nr:hypothetical protein EJ07DRAFT_179068 [Lizonia empirigonia]